MIDTITTEVLEQHRKWLADEPGGEKLVTVADRIKIEANLSRADLRGADLRGANLRWADLRRANLIEANLRGADLRGANLRWADLSGANLRGADLSGADLSGANLRGADLDLAAWPLWCGSNHVKVDAKLAAQLAAHFVALDCIDPAFLRAQAALLPLAVTSHRASDLNTGLETTIQHLQARLEADPPDTALIPAAQVMLESYPRESLPDWVEILANGDPFYLDAVIEIARADIRAEEMTE